MVLTKDCSNMIKGIAVLMMIMHHLWTFPDRIPGLALLNVETQIGSAAKICVSIFMFLSGYGLYYTYAHKGSIRVWHRVKNVYKRFWKVFFIFVPIGLIFLSKPFSIVEFLQNLFCLKFSYNQEWWFLGTYIELLLVLPIVLLADAKKYFPYLIVVSAIILRGMTEVFDLNWGGISHVHMFCYYYPSFFLGLLFCKYSWFEKFKAVFKKETLRTSICILLTGIAFVIRSKFGITEMTILITPLFIYIFAVFLRMIGKASKAFLFLGKHSMNMWLIHTFFCYYYFQKEMLMVSDNAIVDYVLLVAVSLVASMMVEWVWRGIHKATNWILNEIWSM